MLIISILGTGLVIGMLPGFLGVDSIFSIPNIALGSLGALAGAFLGFGDAQYFLEHPFLNEVTLMIGVSFLVVLIKVLVTGNRSTS